MKKSQIVKHLPNLRQYKKEVREKTAQIDRLQKETDDLIYIIDEIDGVVLHNDFPLDVFDLSSGHESPTVEVGAACDEIKRHSLASRDSAEGESPERWRVTGYKTEGTNEGRVVLEGVSRPAAIRAAKDYVAGGKVEARPKTAKSPKATA